MTTSTGRQQNFPGTRQRIENVKKTTVTCYGVFAKFRSIGIIDKIHVSFPMIALIGKFIGKPRLAKHIAIKAWSRILKDVICEGVLYGK